MSTGRPAPHEPGTGNVPDLPLAERVRIRVSRLQRRGRDLLVEVPYLGRVFSDLARIELIDRAMALGAQALLALIPLLMVVGAFMPADWGTELTDQVKAVMGVREEAVEPMEEAAQASGVSAQDVGWVSLLVALASASSFARALQRMYARVWSLPQRTGLSAVRSSLLWIAGWVVTLQIMALLLRALSGIPLSDAVRLTLQLAVNVLLWWWTAHLLLGGRISWRHLLPTALATSFLLVLLSRLSSLFMPAYTAANLEHFGPLGVVFAIGTWLVVFGGVLVVAAILGRHVPWIGEPLSEAETPRL